MNANAPRSRQHTTLCARLDQVSKLFGSFAALRQVSVDLEPGRCYVLLGENGAGKSTLLRILAGLLRPSYGTVRVFGGARAAGGPRPHRLHEPRAHALRRAHRAGEPALLRQPLSRPRLPRAGRCAAPGGPRPRAEPPPRPVFAGHAPAHLAGARAALRRPNCCCSTSLSPTWTSRARGRWSSCWRGFRQSDRTIVLTTHQRELAAPIADWVLTLHAGRVASFEPGSPTL